MGDFGNILESVLSLNPDAARAFDVYHRYSDSSAMGDIANGAPYDASNFHDPLRGAQGAAAFQQYQQWQQTQQAAPQLAELQRMQASGQRLDLKYGGLNKGEPGATDQYTSPKSLDDFVQPSHGITSDQPMSMFTPQQMANPALRKGISDFQVQQSQNDTLTRLLSGQGKPEDLARLSSLDSGQKVNALRQAKESFLPKAKGESEESGFMQDMMFVGQHAKSIEDFQEGTQEVLKSYPGIETKTVKDFIKETSDQVKDKLKPAKPEAMPAPHPMHFKDGTIQDMRFNPKTGQDEAYGQRYKPTAQQSVEIRQSGAGGSEDSFKKWAPELKKTWFDMYKADKSAIPPFGPRDADSRKAFGKEFAQYLQTGNVSGTDVVMGRGDVKAGQKNVEKLTTTTGALRANEIEANKNLDQLEQLSGHLGNKYIPKINRLKNIISNNLGAPEPGTAEGVAYEAAVQYARVVNKQTTAGALTDSAKKDAVKFLDALSMTDAQRRNKFAQYRKTMTNAMESQYQAIDEAKKGRSGGSLRGGAMGQPMFAKNPKTGHRLQSNDGGKTWTEAK